MHERKLREVKRFRVFNSRGIGFASTPALLRTSTGLYATQRSAHTSRSTSTINQDATSTVVEAPKRGTGGPTAWAKNGIVISAVTVVAVGLTFWITFFLTLLCLWGIQVFYVPPKILNFPIPLDYDPFMRSTSGNVISKPSYPVYEMKSPPALFLTHGDQSGLSFDEDAVRFQAAVPPDAIIGFTDLRFNISGLLAPIVPKRSVWSHLTRPVFNLFWRVLGVSPTRDKHWGNLKGYPAQMVLEFLYNPQGWHGSSYSSQYAASYRDHGDSRPNSWLADSALKAVDFRVVLYTDQGQKVLEMVNGFFPEQQLSRFGEALYMARSTLFNFLLSLSPFSLFQPQSNWRLGRVVLVDNLVLPSMAPHTSLNKGRYIKVRISPRLPIRDMHLIFQSEVTGITSLLQNYPTLMPFTLALALGSLLAILALCVCFLTAVVLGARTLGQRHFIT